MTRLPAIRSEQKDLLNKVPPPSDGFVISWGVIKYQCYQIVSASQLITTTDNSGPKEVTLGGAPWGGFAL